jgi:DNA-binding GntR family transcriptional regulator
MSSLLSQRAYQHIQRKLLESPPAPGSRISEEGLARELRISRQPVRDAIRRLSSEGILYQVPGSGTYVAQPSREQLIEAYQLRRTLELDAAGRAARRPVAGVSRRLLRLCERMSARAARLRRLQSTRLDDSQYGPFLRADMAFHLLVLRAAGNYEAFKVVSDTFLRSQIHGTRPARRDPAAVARVWTLHTQVAQAIVEGDPRGARRWLRRHFAKSLRDALETFDLRPQPEADPHRPSNADQAMDEMIQHLCR